MTTDSDNDSNYTQQYIIVSFSIICFIYIYICMYNCAPLFCWIKPRQIRTVSQESQTDIDAPYRVVVIEPSGGIILASQDDYDDDFTGE